MNGCLRRPALRDRLVLLLWRSSPRYVGATRTSHLNPSQLSPNGLFRFTKYRVGPPGQSIGAGALQGSSRSRTWRESALVSRSPIRSRRCAHASFSVIWRRFSERTSSCTASEGSTAMPIPAATILHIASKLRTRMRSLRVRPSTSVSDCRRSANDVSSERLMKS
jgi:hypothetical protein